ncbi:MAG: InlB B-repeat-containing protein [Clostridiales bacterium]|nr:InlB B-repeat-containing protein [Clostridiales bacterium]
MTRLSKKCVWIIVLAALAVATFIAIAWGSSGFKNMDPAMWFNYWGKGKPAKVVTVEEQPIEQRAMALTSADDTHEIITDSGDSVVTFATTKLVKPTLSVDIASHSIKVTVNSNIIGTVKVSIRPYTGGSPDKILAFTSEDFTIETSSSILYIPFEDIRSAFKQSYVLSALDTYCACLYAEHVDKAGYVNSDTSSRLYICDTSEIEAEFSGSVYRASFSETFFNNGLSMLNVYASNGRPILGLKDKPYVSYDNGYVEVDLLSLSNALAEFDYSGVYRLQLAYGSYSLNLGVEGTYSVRPISAAANNDFVITHLAAPENLTYNAGTITWDSVEGATDYGVFWTVNNVEQKAFVNTTSYTFDINALGEGEHTVRVRALGNLGQTAIAEGRTMSITAYNASNVITQVVALTYNIDGDVVIKFVPYGSKLTDYIYDVNIKGREFGGWYYDSGFSRKVADNDVLSGDTTIYARLSDIKVTERKLTWWEQHRWQVLGPIIAAVVVGIVIAVVVGIRKRKAA